MSIKSKEQALEIQDHIVTLLLADHMARINDESIKERASKIRHYAKTIRSESTDRKMRARARDIVLSKNDQRVVEMAILLQEGLLEIPHPELEKVRQGNESVFQ